MVYGRWSAFTPVELHADQSKKKQHCYTSRYCTRYPAAARNTPSWSWSSVPHHKNAWHVITSTNMPQCDPTWHGTFRLLTVCLTVSLAQCYDIVAPWHKFKKFYISCGLPWLATRCFVGWARIDAVTCRNTPQAKTAQVLIYHKEKKG